MKILAVDTSTMLSSCSVMEDGYVIGDFSINQQKTHSETLIPMIEDMLSRVGINIEDIDLFVSVNGPGSFTGIRIGVTTVKALAMALDKKIVSVNTLQAMAFGVFTEKNVVPLIDARGERVYYGIYKNYCEEIVESPSMCNIDELLEKLSNTDKEYIFTGDCSKLYEDRILKNSKFKVTHSALNNCISRNALVIGEKLFNENKLDDYFTLSPEYIRDSQAQDDYKKRKN